MAGTMSRARSLVVAGLEDARGAFRLVLFVWAVLLGVSLIAVWPAWQWWSDALARSVEADRLLYGLDLPLIKDIVQYDRTSALRMTAQGALAAAVFAALLNPLFTGGLLAAIAQKQPRATVQAFVANGVRWYGPCLRAFIMTVVVAGIVLSAVVAVTTPGLSAVAETDAETTSIGLAVAEAALMALLVAFFAAVLDVARARLILDDSRRAVAAVRHALLFVPRHLVRFAGLGLAYLSLTIALATAIFGLQSLLPDRPVSGCWLCAGSWTTLVLGAAVWQVFALGRLWLRSALIASTFALVEARSAVSATVAEGVEPREPEAPPVEV
jgi:hypothetical protein